MKTQQQEGVRLENLDRLGKPYYLAIDPNTLDYSALQQFENCMRMESAVKGFLAPDYHLGYVAPIGSVIATKDTIVPALVSYDIGCGMSECMLDIKVDSVSKDQLEKIKKGILERIPIGFKRHNKEQPIPRDILNMPMSEFAKDVLIRQGGSQIGTLGGGKDYCFQVQR